jgi:hypothetical protein
MPTTLSYGKSSLQPMDDLADEGFYGGAVWFEIEF